MTSSPDAHQSHAPDCIFCKIAAGQIPAKKLYEDEDLVAFDDINPAAPVHFLIIPKRHLPSLAHASLADAPLLGKILAKAPELALQRGCNPYPQGGFRVVINTGEEGGQEVHHLHVHVMGGPRPWRK